MAISNTPPQAYTREVLAQAFNWLKSQHPNIRERANSADALVTLFLQAKRFPSPAVSAWEQNSEVGAKAFRTDLKNLAQGFKDFEGGAFENSGFEGDKVEELTTQQQTVQTVTTTQLLATRAACAVAPALQREWDDRTLEIIVDVQKRLNLSTEMEALRLLVVYGYDKLKSNLPEP
jgi:hypothetical protein